MAKNKPNQGARKTETLTLRLDPKIKFAIELMSRVRRQSITSVVESAIDQVAFEFDVPYIEDGKKTTFALSMALSEIWSTDESYRFLGICFHMPDILTYEEQRIWETIKVTPYFWDNEVAGFEDPMWKTPEGPVLNPGLVRSHWGELLAHVESNKDSRTVVPCFT